MLMSIIIGNQILNFEYLRVFAHYYHYEEEIGTGEANDGRYNSAKQWGTGRLRRY